MSIDNIVKGLALSLLAFGFTGQMASAQSAEAVTTNVKFTTLHSFTGVDGATPAASLLQANNGDFYGATEYGGANCAADIQCGTVYKITPSGTFNAIYSFCSQVTCPDGKTPGSLVQAANGDFYGVAGGGGTYYRGTLFQITSRGTLTTIYTFCDDVACAGGPGELMQAANGDLYGITSGGGGDNTYGTMFTITHAGVLTTLSSFFCPNICPDGSGPEGLIQATNGNFYGTAAWGGFDASTPSCYHGCGTIFKITPEGSLTRLYGFCSQPACADGTTPSGYLVQATNGDLYGTTAFGGQGSNCLGTVGCGTIFRITTGGTLTTIHNFCLKSGCPDGYFAGQLIQAANGDLYGVTNAGGAHGYGTIFRMTPNGALVTLYNFCSQTGCADGSAPTSLTQATNGIFYGTTTGGGTNGYGTVFSFSINQAAFIEARPIAGKAGDVVRIIGTNLSGATGVRFDGVAAAFTVESASEISTTVPAGATTGKIEVTTPDRTLSSNVPFRIP
jgi:uncharacterized repeat protein (TIGR03803 family)